MQTIYKDRIISKTGMELPVLNSGKTIESLYNPEKDAERRIQNLNITENFIIVLGLGSGLLVKNLLQTNPELKILCVEYSEKDIDFLKSFPCVKEIQQKIILVTKEKLYTALLENYLPALYGNLRIIEQTNYLNENPEYSSYISEEIKRSLDDLSKDYSVQAHFGKIWQHNILSNVKSIKTETKLAPLPKDKTCAILAAGPTLDREIEKIIENREKYFVLSTDTAFSVCSKKKLFCDAVISLDAQNISCNHFLHNIDKKTLFLLDFCSSSGIVRKIRRNGNDIFFFSTGHPLVSYLFKNQDIVKFSAGSGSVTIAALNFALYYGFKEIQTIGADFSYPGNKPYCKGTYLDPLYNKNSDKKETSEKTFNKLMYRTELITRGSVKTTAVLDSYKESFENFLNSKDLSWTIKQNVYVIKKNIENISKEFSNKPVSIKQISENDFTSNNGLITAFLPLLAFLRKKDPAADRNDLLKKAISDYNRYSDL
ncbi:MAG: DUF115 domain-containing protein [Treponema sp.]|nr:DUF115 domain-containing protein [Treponema sp.]